MQSLECKIGTEVLFQTNSPTVKVFFRKTEATPDQYLITITPLVGTAQVAGFTPLTTGTFLICDAAGVAVARISSQERTSFEILKDLRGAEFGSWLWDKVAGTMIIKSEAGAELVRFKMTANDLQAAREPLPPVVPGP